MVQNTNNEPRVRQRVRIRFSKSGDLRLIGHRDLARTLERLFRRSGLRLGMSEGFHPKPRMSFPSALAVGIEGCEEVIELELAENRTPQALLRRLSEFAFSGIKFAALEVLAQGARKARVRSFTYEIPIAPRRRRGLPQRIRRLMDSASCIICREKDQRSMDLRPQLENLSVSDGILAMKILVSAEATPGAREVFSALRLPPGEMYRGQGDLYPKRTTVELEK